MNILCLIAATAASNALEPVVVTATRTAVPREEVLASVDVIARSELERTTGADLGDVLRGRAGVEVARLGGMGQQTSVFLRGTDSNHVLVLVDGVRINPGTIGSAAIQNLAPGLIERIEIVRGPRSTLYGSDAIGGVINVITRHGGETRASLQAGLGRYGTQDADFQGALHGERADASIGLSWLDSDGFPTRRGDSEKRGFRNRSATAAVTTAQGGVELGLRAWHASGTTEYSDFFLAPVDQDFENAAFAAAAAFEPAGNWRSRLSLAHAVDEVDQNQGPDFLQTRRWTVDWQNDFTVADRHALTAGILWQDEDADARSFGLPYAARTETRQAYLQDQVGLGEHRLLLAAGYTDHETFGGHFTWNAELGFALGDATDLVLGAGRAFRAPDATDLYGFGGNPGLDPERSESYEASLRHRTAGGHHLSLTAFRNEIDDLIEFVITDFQTFEGENRNVDRARIDGIEAEWRYDGALWSARATASVSDPKNLVTDERLLRRARRNASASVLRRVGRHEFAAEIQHAGERRDFGFPSAVPLPAYTLVGLSARVAVGRRWTLLARMENLLDEEYELASGYNSPGRGLYVAIRHDFH